jgi:hypothetical protein
LHGISIYMTNREKMGDIYIVTARAKDRTGREDESTGAVALGNLKGDALANALMKAETKAKRRVTLSVAGLGWLDETELETIPQAGRDSVPSPLPAGEDVSQQLPERHPSADEVTTLVECARSANISNDDFAHDMRRVLQLPESQKITCSSLILSGRRLDYIARVQLEFGENSGTFRLTLSENRLGISEKNLITSGAAGII